MPNCFGKDTEFRGRGREAALHVPAAFHGLQHGDFVGVLDVAADRDSHGDAGDFESGALSCWDR